MKTRHILPLLVAFTESFGLTPADPRPIPLPERPLEWGDVNVLHTTDIHGWMLGHTKNVYPEMSWSGTFGDLYSFVNHMRTKARRHNVDLFLVDTGDRRIGHGLTDKVYTPDSLNGKLVGKMYLDLKYDVIVPGNHDLSSKEVVEYVMTTYADRWEGKYLTSNIRRVKPQKARSLNSTKEDGREFLGAPYRYWKTENKNKVLAFGVLLYNERKNDTQISITKVEDMVKEEWFQGALTLPTDIFMVLGHIDTKQPKPYDDMRLIHDAIRKVHPGKPILMFGGHSHKRYCERLRFKEGGWRSMILQSGRYFDTVGWMSMKRDDNDPHKNLVMTRRYLDNNVPTYMYHTGTNDTNFHMRTGQEMTNSAYGIDRSEGLSQVYGYLDSNYYLDRKEWTEEEKDPESLFTLYLDAVQSKLIDRNRSKHWMFFSNWGIIRSDIYEGSFSLGDFYTITPDASDKSPYYFVRVRRDMVNALRNQTQQSRRKSQIHSNETRGFGYQREAQTLLNGGSQVHPSSGKSSGSSDLTYGWETTDRCGEEGKEETGVGDDVRHLNIPQVVLDGSDGNPEVFFWRKSWKDQPEPSPSTMVDVIFPKYIGQKNVPPVLKNLGLNVTPEVYRTDVTQDKLLGLYIRDEFKSITSNIPFPE